MKKEIVNSDNPNGVICEHCNSAEYVMVGYWFGNGCLDCKKPIEGTLKEFSKKSIEEPKE